MEHFCENVIHKCCVNYENEQVKDISVALSELIKRFVTPLQENNDDFAISRVDQCGSMTERTRITTSGIEFDYLAVLKKTGFLARPCTHCNLEGCAQVFCNTKGLERKEIKSETVLASFNKKLFDNIKNECRKRNCLPEGCEYCSIQKDTGTLKLKKYIENSELKLEDIHYKKLNFLWMPNDAESESIRMCLVEGEKLQECKFINYKVSNKRLYYIPLAERGNDGEMFSHMNPDTEHKPLKSDRTPIEPGLEIELDFHPILELEPDSPNNELNFKCTQKVFLFPKPGKRDECKGWRISTYDTELSIMQRTTHNHRQAYMVLKFVLEQINGGIAGHISSFYLKTGIFHHIRDCDSKSLESTVNECVIAVLNFLSVKFNCQNLPNFVSGANLILTSEYLSVPKFPEFAKSHCESLAHVLKVVSDYLSAKIHGDIETIVNELRRIKRILADISAVEHRTSQLFIEKFDKCMRE